MDRRRRGMGTRSDLSALGNLRWARLLGPRMLGG